MSTVVTFLLETSKISRFTFEICPGGKLWLSPPPPKKKKGLWKGGGGGGVGAEDELLDLFMLTLPYSKILAKYS